MVCLNTEKYVKHIVELLLNRGAIPNIPNRFGITALRLAELTGQNDIVRLLKRHMVITRMQSNIRGKNFMDKSLTFEQFLATTSSEISLFGFVINLVITAVLAHILSIIYVKFGQSLSNRHVFSRNFMLIAMTIMVVITVVKSSLALSLGLVGALSIVRYRTAIKEPEELAYTFLTIAIGLGMGADQTAVTAVSFLLIVAIIIIRQKLMAEKGEFVNLRISGKKNTDYDFNSLVQLVEKNTKFRADESRAIYKSIKNHIPNSVIASAQIVSKPEAETNAVLIDASKFFLYDFLNVLKRTNNKYIFDKENSYFNYIKSFPLNSEIDFYLHYKSKNPSYRFTLASSKSMMHRYHISIS